MRSIPSRRALALASVLAVGSTALVASGSAQASLPGSGSVLTTSDGSTTLKFFGGASGTLTNPYNNMTDAAWSPDGSRAAYIDQFGGVSSIRYNGLAGGDILPVVEPPAEPAERNSVSWRGTGGSIVWAEKPTGAKWGIRVSPSSSGYSYPLTSDATKHYLNPDGGVQGLVVFQRQDDNGSGQPTGTPAVMLYNPASQQVTLVDADGSNPAIAPDGKQVAFVRANQIIVSDLAGENEVVVADAATGTDNPTWSPDGKRIAFNRGSAVYTAAADGTEHAAPGVVSGASGEPAYQPRHRDRAVRLFGSNRFTTATAASKSHWATEADPADQREQAQVAVLSRSDTFADALAGSALAAAKAGPLLMTPPNSLNADTAAELTRVLAPGATVYVLGSEGALSATVFNAVKDLGFTPKRLAGSDRFGTSVAIANEINPNPDLVLLATGMNFPDALAAGAAAGSFHGPGAPSAVVVLSLDAKLPAATKSYLDGLSSDHYLFGVGRSAAQAALAYDANALQVWGENRFETAYAAAYVFFGGENYAGLATGMDWPDALSGGALMGRLNGPLLLTLGTSSTMSAEATWRLDESSGSVHTGLIFGSSAVVADSQKTQLGTWIGGPLGSELLNNSTDVVTLESPVKSGGATALRGAGTTAGDSVMRTPEEAAAAAEQLRERPAKR